VTLRNDLLLRALRREPAERTPVWFMRQAGRALPEYRAIRERASLLEICRNPDLCAEVTIQPVRRYGVDAAILFADIMLPLIGVGVDLDIVEGVGPVVAHPIAAGSDLSVLRPLEPADVAFVADDIAAVLARLGNEVPLIGFSGAPFTLASYLIEGRPSRDFLRTKRLMYGAPALWDELMMRLARVVAAYLRIQVEAGVHALQLFDSWVGALSLGDYVRYVRPYVRAIFDEIAELPVPTIHFGVGTAHVLEAMRDAGGDTIGVDWRLPLDAAWERIGHDRGIQGNLDPMALHAPAQVMEAQAADILRRAAGRPGHTFNVGHGIHPQTDPDQVSRLVEFVRRMSERERGEPAASERILPPSPSSVS